MSTFSTSLTPTPGSGLGVYASWFTTLLNNTLALKQGDQAFDFVNAGGRVQLAGASITLANGRNDNVVVGNTSYIHAVTGPTGAFQISGIVPPGGSSVDGQFLIIFHNTGFVLTFNHADTNSAAANRISCPGSANKATSATFGCAVLIYNTLIPGWALLFGS